MIFTYWTGPSRDHRSNPLPSVAKWRERWSSFRVFGDDEVLQLIDEFQPGAAETFAKIKIAACKSDLARLVLLNKFGGMYVDAHCGPGERDRILSLFALLADREVVLFDKTWEHQHDNDIHLMNTVMLAQASGEAITRLLRSSIKNVELHRMNEARSTAYVPYNIFVLTGAWDITVQLFDHLPGGVRIKPEFEGKVHTIRIAADEDAGFHLYKHYGYRQPGQHWSERQKVERLFASP